MYCMLSIQCCVLTRPGRVARKSESSDQTSLQTTLHLQSLHWLVYYIIQTTEVIAHTEYTAKTQCINDHNSEYTSDDKTPIDQHGHWQRLRKNSKFVLRSDLLKKSTSSIFDNAIVKIFLTQYSDWQGEHSKFISLQSDHSSTSTQDCPWRNT